LLKNKKYTKISNTYYF